MAASRTTSFSVRCSISLFSASDYPKTALALFGPMLYLFVFRIGLSESRSRTFRSDALSLCFPHRIVRNPLSHFSVRCSISLFSASDYPKAALALFGPMLYLFVFRIGLSEIRSRTFRSDALAFNLREIGDFPRRGANTVQ